MINALIDSNVVLDSLANRVPFNKESDAIFDLIKEGRINGYITAGSVTDIYYLLNKAVGYNLCLKYLKNLFEGFEVVSVTKADCVDALKFPIIDYEDALVAVCSDKAGLDFIVTRDVKFLSAPKTITPSDLFKKF